MSETQLTNSSRYVLGIMLMSPYFIALTLLANFGQGTTLDSALVFIIIGITSLVFANIARMNGYEPFKWWTGKLDPHERKHLAIGIVALLGVVIGTTTVIPGSEGILVALLLGGFVLAYMLFKTETIIIPWFVHAAYNLTVLALAGGLFLVCRILCGTAVIKPHLRAGIFSRPLRHWPVFHGWHNAVLFRGIC